MGYFMVLSVMRISVRQQKWAQISTLPDHQLSTFKFKKNQISPKLKHVNKREILVDGKLFDIARKIDDGNSITYYCVRDAKEEKLIAKTRQFNTMAQPVPAKNTARLIIEKIIKTAVFNSESETFDQEYTQLSTYDRVSLYTSPCIGIKIPPPQFSC